MLRREERGRSGSVRSRDPDVDLASMSTTKINQSDAAFNLQTFKTPRLCFIQSTITELAFWWQYEASKTPSSQPAARIGVEIIANKKIQGREYGSPDSPCRPKREWHDKTFLAECRTYPHHSIANNSTPTSFSFFPIITSAAFGPTSLVLVTIHCPSPYFTFNSLPIFPSAVVSEPAASLLLKRPSTPKTPFKASNQHSNNHEAYYWDYNQKRVFATDPYPDEYTGHIC